MAIEQFSVTCGYDLFCGPARSDQAAPTLFLVSFGCGVCVACSFWGDAWALAVSFVAVDSNLGYSLYECKGFGAIIYFNLDMPLRWMR